jgi:serine beta-lactamase-like protein LACTB
MRKGLCSFGLWLGVLVCAIAVARAAAQAPAPDRFGPARVAGRSATNAIMAADRIPGLSIAVAIRGQMVWSEQFGYADVERRLPVTRTTRFRLGSVSKVLTIAALAKLHESGQIDLDAPIQRYVPAFPEKNGVITARRLAGHLAGIRHYQDKDFVPNGGIDALHFDTAAQALTIFENDPLVALPGERYAYSTFGFTLLTAAIERASRTTFLRFLKDEVTGPLGMTHTAADDPRALVPERAKLYDVESGGAIRPSTFVDPSYKWGGGGMMSTADDLIRFGTAHLQPGFLKADTLGLLFTSQRTAGGTETGVGIGWQLSRDTDGRVNVHHNGNMQGCRALILIYPNEGLVIAMLTNLGGRPAYPEERAREIAAPFLRTSTGAGAPSR